MLDGILLRSNFALQVASMALVFGGTTLAMSLLKGPRPQSLAGLATLLGIFSLGGLGFGLAMSLVFRFLLLQYRVWRFHRQNPILFGEVELVLGNDGVEFTDSRSAARYSWTDVKGYKESGKGFLLRLSKSFAFFIPKQNQSPAAIDEFRDICGRNARRLR